MAELARLNRKLDALQKSMCNPMWVMPPTDIYADYAAKHGITRMEAKARLMSAAYSTGPEGIQALVGLPVKMSRAACGCIEPLFEIIPFESHRRQCRDRWIREHTCPCRPMPPALITPKAWGLRVGYCPGKARLWTGTVIPRPKGARAYSVATGGVLTYVVRDRDHAI